MKWRTNTLMLLGTADLSGPGGAVSDGTRILTQLNDEAAELGKLEPGADATRLGRDAQQLFAASIQAAGASRGVGPRSRESLVRIQDQFQPILDRMDRDAHMAARHQQVVAAQALTRSLWLSIGSMLLGVGLLGVLGWRLAFMKRRSALADKERAMERRSERRVRALVDGLLADDPEALAGRLRRLKRLGARIAIDDFGTGYSALSHLRQFPVDVLKLDKSFIDQLTGDTQNANLVESIINLGRSLHVDVIAEGIEQAQQAEQLRAIRATLGQGFLFSEPTDPAAILAWLRGSAESQPAHPAKRR